jgi:hypothetical protein
MRGNNHNGAILIDPAPVDGPALPGLRTAPVGHRARRMQPVGRVMIVIVMYRVVRPSTGRGPITAMRRRTDSPITVRRPTTVVASLTIAQVIQGTDHVARQRVARVAAMRAVRMRAHRAVMMTDAPMTAIGGMRPLAAAVMNAVTNRALSAAAKGIGGPIIATVPPEADHVARQRVALAAAMRAVQMTAHRAVMMTGALMTAIGGTRRPVPAAMNVVLIGHVVRQRVALAAAMRAVQMTAHRAVMMTGALMTAIRGTRRPVPAAMNALVTGIDALPAVMADRVTGRAVQRRAVPRRAAGSCDRGHGPRAAARRIARTGGVLVGPSLVPRIGHAARAAMTNEGTRGQSLSR